MSMTRGVVTISEDAESIIRAEHHDPFSYLGMHPVEMEGRKLVVVRAFIPEAQTADVMDIERGGIAFPMEKIHPDGLFEVFIEDQQKVFPYRIKTTDFCGDVSEFHDPYSFLPVMTQYDLHLFAEGKNYFVFQKMGAHPMSVNNIRGVYFA